MLPTAGIYILIAVGAVMMFVGFLGCYGAIQESQCLLGTVRPGPRWAAASSLPRGWGDVGQSWRTGPGALVGTALGQRRGASGSRGPSPGRRLSVLCWVHNYHHDGWLLGHF